jgi:hypothetical protein
LKNAVLCSYCGFQQHSGGNCPAAQDTCDFCHKRGHYNSVHPQRLNQRSNEQNQHFSHNRTVNFIEQTSEIIAAPASDMDFISKIEDSKPNAKILQTNLIFMISGRPHGLGQQYFIGTSQQQTKVNH